jgi:RNA recognition motif-containing protein
MKRIYVGNLHTETTAGHLELLFQKYGKVSKAGIVCDGETGQSRGFAFVLMGNDHEGETAIQNLNQQQVDGRAMDVKEALPPEERSNGNTSR